MSDDDLLRRYRRFWFGTMGAIGLVILVGIAIGVALKPPGHHRHWVAGLTATGVFVVVLVIVTIGGWRVFRRDKAMLQLQRFPWRARRRAMIDLRKGRPITPENRAVAQALIDFHQRRWFVGLWLGLGAIWVLNTIFAHGNRRWMDLGLAVLYFGMVPYWLRMRRKILNRAGDLPAPAV